MSLAGKRGTFNADKAEEDFPVVASTCPRGPCSLALNLPLQLFAGCFPQPTASLLGLDSLQLPQLIQTGQRVIALVPVDCSFRQGLPRARPVVRVEAEKGKVIYFAQGVMGEAASMNSVVFKRYSGNTWDASETYHGFFERNFL